MSTKRTDMDKGFNLRDTRGREVVASYELRGSDSRCVRFRNVFNVTASLAASKYSPKAALAGFEASAGRLNLTLPYLASHASTYLCLEAAPPQSRPPEA